MCEFFNTKQTITSANWRGNTMKLVKQITMSLTAFSLMLSNLAYAQNVLVSSNQTPTQSSAVSTDQIQKATALATQNLMSLKKQGGRLEDEKGRELSTGEIMSGMVKTVVYIPADGKKLKYVFKSNAMTQSVALSVLKMDGTRIAATNFAVDPNITPQQNVIKMQESVNAIEALVSQSVVSHYKQAKGRFPAAVNRLVSITASIVVGMNIVFCATDPKKRAFNCAVAAGLALFIFTLR